MSQIITIMEFIKVTLLEKSDSAISIANRQKITDYLLPINGIKSVTKKDLSESSDRYYIGILEDFKPNDILFNIGHAEADLPPDFFHIQN